MITSVLFLLLCDGANRECVINERSFNELYFYLAPMCDGKLFPGRPSIDYASLSSKVLTKQIERISELRDLSMKAL